MVAAERELPDIDGANEDLKVILKGMLKSIVAAGEGELTHENCSYPLDIRSYGDWTRFVTNFISKRDEIAEVQRMVRYT